MLSTEPASNVQTLESTQGRVDWQSPKEHGTIAQAAMRIWAVEKRKSRKWLRIRGSNRWGMCLESTTKREVAGLVFRASPDFNLLQHPDHRCQSVGIGRLKIASAVWIAANCHAAIKTVQLLLFAPQFQEVVCRAEFAKPLPDVLEWAGGCRRGRRRRGRRRFRPVRLRFGYRNVRRFITSRNDRPWDTIAPCRSRAGERRDGGTEAAYDWGGDLRRRREPRPGLRRLLNVGWRRRDGLERCGGGGLGIGRSTGDNLPAEEPIDEPNLLRPFGQRSAEQCYQRQHHNADEHHRRADECGSRRLHGQERLLSHWPRPRTTASS